MSGSLQTSGGSPPTTFTRALKLRLAAGIACVLLLLGLVFAVKQTTWKRVSEIQKNFNAVETERFYLGIYLRSGVSTLNNHLLAFQLSEDFVAREKFNREARALLERIGRTRPHLSTAREKDLAASAATAFEAYLQDTAHLLERPLKPLKRDSISTVQDGVVKASAPALRICDQLIEAQHESLDGSFAAARSSLASLHRLLQLSTALLILLVGALTALGYQAVIVPLRQRISQSQAAVERQQKLASLGALAAGVAHEIRNPLTAIKFRLFSFSKELPTGLCEHEDLVVINGQIDRLERIVQDFLQFARPSEPEFAPVEAATIVREIHELLQLPLRRRGTELKVEVPELLRVRADKQQIQQLLINLVQNAADSIDGAGKIEVRAKGGMAKLNEQVRPVVVFEVADNGRGIAPEAEQRLFDPFFSTKAGGTGLGLPIAARIAEQHGGFVQYQSKRNSGTTFSMVLPRIVEHENGDPADRG